MVKYKLVYFNLRGRAEISRLCFAAAGVEFDDSRIQVTDWPTIKPTTPHGELPYIEIDGLPVTQSLAIARYLAREFGLFGDTNMETLRIDEAIEMVEDFRKGFVNYYREAEPTKKAELLETFHKQIKPKYLDIFTKILTENKSGYLIGNKLTLADLALYDVMQYPLDQWESLLDDYSTLRDHRNLIQSKESINNYLKSRPKTEI